MKQRLSIAPGARRVYRILYVGLIISLVLVFLLPLWWLVVSSLSPAAALLEIPPRWFPWPPDLSHYRSLLWGPTESGGSLTNLSAFTIRAFQYSLRNSLLVSAAVTALALVLGFLSAFAFARLGVPFGNTIIYFILLGQMLPVVVLLIPLYLTANRLRVVDNLGTVVILLTALHLPFVIWILRSYLLNIPRELEDAAQVDGASYIQVLLRVIVPLTLPGLVAAGAYTFMQSWNAFMIPLIFTSSDTKRTVTVAIAMFVGRHYTDYALMCAAGVLASLPPIVLALFFQRYLLSGLTAGAVK
jgi:multiple sugar transport system permease protein